MPDLFGDIAIDKEIAIEEKNIEEFDKQYAVILHNDDVTTFDFVIYVLMEVFSKTPEEAINLTFKIHASDKGTAGIYDKDTAYEKLDELDALKQEFNSFLLATVEEVK